jgi:hemoglobin-like flavoprotein
VYQEKLIPQRSLDALNTTLFTASWVFSWQRMYRQVFGLSDGVRDTEKIAKLLHKPEKVIKKVVDDLAVLGYLSLQHEQKELVMDIALLKQSFEMITPQREAFAHCFYQRLFFSYPELQSLFAKADMKKQERSLLVSLAFVVAGIERGDNLRPMLHMLGEKHQRYGATVDHYPLVGGVLLETFHQCLGSKFTPEMQNAWSQAYEFVSTQMIKGAKSNEFNIGQLNMNESTRDVMK